MHALSLQPPPYRRLNLIRRSGYSDTKKRISNLALGTLAEETNIQSGITHARRRKRVSSLILDLLAKRWCSQNAHFNIAVISPHNHGGTTGINLRQSTRYSRAKEKQNVHSCSSQAQVMPTTYQLRIMRPVFKDRSQTLLQNTQKTANRAACLRTGLRHSCEISRSLRIRRPVFKQVSDTRQIPRKPVRSIST